MQISGINVFSLLDDYDCGKAQSITEQRKNECSTDLALFAKTFFPGIFTGEFCEFHYEVFKALEEHTLKHSNEKYYFVRAAPRGHGKSQILSFAYPLWCALYGYAKNILIVSDTAEQATQFVMAIKDELEENELILDTFGNKEGGLWAQQKIITRDKIQIVAKGAGQKLRGIKYRQFRPDTIIIDDLENDENVETEAQRAKLLNWFQKALLPCGSVNEKVFYIGTILNYESLLNKVLTMPEYSMWDRKKYQAVYKFSKSPLWDKWENILRDESNKNAGIKADNFFRKHRDAMLRDTKVLWEGKMQDHYYDLMKIRFMNPESFDSEYQNDPISEATRDFKEEWFSYWTILPEITGVYIGVDPSLAKKSKSDTSAIVAIGKGADNLLYVLNASIARRKPDKIIDDLISMCIMYRKKLIKVGIEAVQFQAFFATECAKRAIAMDMPLPIEPMSSTIEKSLRLKGLIPFVKNGTLKFHTSQTRLLNEMKRFPKGSDDGMDALKFAIECIYPTGGASLPTGLCFGSIGTMNVNASKKKEGVLFAV